MCSKFTKIRLKTSVKAVLQAYMNKMSSYSVPYSRYSLDHALDKSIGQIYIMSRGALSSGWHEWYTWVRVPVCPGLNAVSRDIYMKSYLDFGLEEELSGVSYQSKISGHTSRKLESGITKLLRMRVSKAYIWSCQEIKATGG